MDKLKSEFLTWWHDTEGLSDIDMVAHSWRLTQWENASFYWRENHLTLGFWSRFDVLAAFLKFTVAKLSIFKRIFFLQSLQCRNCTIFRRKRIFVDISMHLLFPYHYGPLARRTWTWTSTTGSQEINLRWYCACLHVYNSPSTCRSGRHFGIFDVVLWTWVFSVLFKQVLLLFLEQYVDLLRRLASWKILEELRLVPASCNENKRSFIPLCRSSLTQLLQPWKRWNKISLGR